MISDKFVILGVLINFFGSAYYIADTLKGKTRPNRVTWILWTVAPLVAFAAQKTEGVGLSALVTFTAGFIPLLILISSFINKKSHWNLTKFDLFCGLLSVIGLMMWAITSRGNVAIIFSILADAFAAIPTIRKAFMHPETETWQGFLAALVSAAVALLTINKWNFASYSFPAYLILANGIIVILILRPKIKSYA